MQTGLMLEEAVAGQAGWRSGSANLEPAVDTEEALLNGVDDRQVHENPVE
jgi:hypothetical protein